MSVWLNGKAVPLELYKVTRGFAFDSGWAQSSRWVTPCKYLNRELEFIRVRIPVHSPFLFAFSNAIVGHIRGNNLLVTAISKLNLK